MRWHAWMVRWNGIIGVSLLTCFSLLLLALHVVGALQGYVPRYLSHFSTQPYGWLWILGLYLFTLGTVSLSLGAHNVIPRNRWGRGALLCVSTIPVFALGVAIFPAAEPGAVETQFAERLHEAAAVGMILAISAGMVLTGVAVRHLHERVARASLAMGLLVALVLPWSLHGFLIGSADVIYSERILVMLQGLWLFGLAIWTGRAARAGLVYS